MYAYLLLGTNLGDRRQNLRMALEMIAVDCGRIDQISGIYESPALGFTKDAPLFYNLAVKLAGCLPPETLIERLLSIEETMGRRRVVQADGGYSSRVIDIDILLFGDLQIASPQLVVPHPRMHERRFALMPLSEIGETVLVPGSRKPVSELLACCSDDSVVIHTGDL